MPRLLWLMFQVPMSSPQMMRMLGFRAWAAASAATSRRHDDANAAIPTHRVQRLVGFVLFIASPHFGSGFVLDGWHPLRIGLHATKSEGAPIACSFTCGFG